MSNIYVLKGIYVGYNVDLNDQADYMFSYFQDWENLRQIVVCTYTAND